MKKISWLIAIFALLIISCGDGDPEGDTDCGNDPCVCDIPTSENPVAIADIVFVGGSAIPAKITENPFGIIHQLDEALIKAYKVEDGVHLNIDFDTPIPAATITDWNLTLRITYVDFADGTQPIIKLFDADGDEAMFQASDNIDGAVRSHVMLFRDWSNIKTWPGGFTKTCKGIEIYIATSAEYIKISKIEFLAD